MQWVAIFILLSPVGISQNRLEAFKNEADCNKFINNYVVAFDKVKPRDNIEVIGMCVERVKPKIDIW